MSVRLGIAAGGAAILFTLLFISGWLLFDVFGQTTNPLCTNGTTVPNHATNPGLVADCTALLAAKDTLRGTATLNWGGTVAIGSWDKITLSGTPQRVSEINFNLFGPDRQRPGAKILTGTLPSSLGNLSALTRLTLYNNDLTGSIPTQLGNLTNLTRLDLGGNKLTGSIPTQLGSATSLTFLSLADNQLTGGIPTQLGNLTNLQELELNENNSLGGTIPTELGNLTSLTRLVLRRNGLTGSIPTSLGNLTSLRVLDFRNNGLTRSIPTQLGSATSLELLYLNNNSLSGSIPTELGNLTSLENLFLHNNMLSGQIPTELGNLTRITRLRFHNNMLTSEFPSWIGNLTSLQNFTIHRNPLNGGYLPIEISASAEVVLADANGPIPTNMIGCLPSWATTNTAVLGEELLPLSPCGSPPIESVWLLDTVLDPQSPVATSMKTALTLRATYTIPRDYVVDTSTPGRLQFRQLDARVSTGGSMTISLARRATSTSPQLAGFDTRPAGSTGVPAASELTRTTTLSSSSFTCEDSRSRWSPTLRRLVLPDTIQVVCTAPVGKDIWALQGAHTESPYDISVEVYGAFSLTTEVNWEDRITSTVGGTGKNWEVTNLAVVEGSPPGPPPPPTATPTPPPPPPPPPMGPFDECRNGVTVPDPRVHTQLVADCDALLEARHVLQGSSTLNWDGMTAVSNWPGITVYPLPSVATTTPRRVTRINLDDTGLDGSIPAKLGDLSGLQVLRLRQNRLSGSIPTKLGDIDSLQRMFLSGNRLSGSIPTELGTLSNLQYLELGHNELTGSIPAELGALSDLRQLDLANNRLSGSIPTELGDIDSLRYLYLANNRLDGQFPTWPKDMGNLWFFSIQGNPATTPLPSENPFHANIREAFIGRLPHDPVGPDPVGCIPSWALGPPAGTDKGNVILGEENLNLPPCGSPRIQSVWDFDTDRGPNPVEPHGHLGQHADKTRVTLRATYTIPNETLEYLAAATTTDRFVIESLTAQVAPGGVMTLSVERHRAQPRQARFAGFDNRPSGSTGDPRIPGDLTQSKTFDSSALTCSGVTVTRGVLPDRVEVVCSLEEDVWIVQGAYPETNNGANAYVVSVRVDPPFGLNARCERRAAERRHQHCGRDYWASMEQEGLADRPIREHLGAVS